MLSLNRLFCPSCSVRKQNSRKHPPALAVEMLEDRNCPSGLGFEPTFGSPFHMGSGPVAILTGLFNADSYLDLATANVGSDRVEVRFGDGAGEFLSPPDPPSSYAVGHEPRSIAKGDFNRDGRLDLAVANTGSDDITILLGDGGGGFHPAAGSPFSSGGNRPLAVATGDFTGDGLPELAVANNGRGGLSILSGDGTGAYFFIFHPSIGIDLPVDVGVGDFNGDRFADLAVLTTGGVPGEGRVKILLSEGTGDFLHTTFPTFIDGFPSSLAVADFNGDGYDDVAVGHSTNSKVAILLSDGAGRLFVAPASPVRVGGEGHSLAVGDFNRDQAPDLAVASSGGDHVNILLGSGAGSFRALAGSPFDVGNDPSGIVVDDFNRDGLPDMATANRGSDDVTVLLNTLPAISINELVIVVEGDAGVTNAVFTVSLSRPVDEPLTLDYVTVFGEATAGIDYVNTFGALTFAPGQTSRLIVVPVIGDTLAEGSQQKRGETFRVRISNPSQGVIVNNIGLCAIDDDDIPLMISIKNAIVLERDTGVTEATLTVSLNRPHAEPVTLDYATLFTIIVEGEATAGVDYQPTSGSLTFQPGQTERFVTVLVIADTIDESVEHFFVQIDNSSYGEFTNHLGQITIVDDDEPLTIAITDATVTEGHDGVTQAVFTVSLSRAHAEPVTLEFYTVNDTARAEQDYESASGLLTFLPEQTARTIVVKVLGDRQVEADESFFLIINNATAGTIERAQGQGIILNDDGAEDGGRGGGASIAGTLGATDNSAPSGSAPPRRARDAGRPAVRDAAWRSKFTKKYQSRSVKRTGRVAWFPTFGFRISRLYWVSAVARRQG